MTPRPTFYYDLGSPYAWLAAERIDALFAPTEPEWVPVLLGGIFRATGRSSWARTDARAEGIEEIESRAAARGLPPLRWPDPWPNDGLTAMRAATYAHTEGRGKAFALAAFRLQFTEGEPLSDLGAIAEAAARVDLDPDAAVAATSDPEVKQRLRDATERALARGVTGIPATVVGTSVHWGDDALDDAAQEVVRRASSR